MNLKGTAFILAILIVAFSALMFEKHRADQLKDNCVMKSLLNAVEDGKEVSAADIKEFLDTNIDGNISKSEVKAFQAAVQIAEPGGEPPCNALKTMDSDENGILSQKEIAVLDPVLDTNADSKVSTFELIDLDQSGTVTTAECSIALHTPGKCSIDTDNSGTVSPAEAEAASSDMDKSGDNKLGFADIADLNGDSVVTVKEAADLQQQVSEIAKDTNGDSKVSLTEKMDKNGDGTVTSEECKDVLQSTNCLIDHNKDGTVSKDEMSEDSIRQSLDKNKDNIVTYGEAFDKDKSGTLSADELQTAKNAVDTDKNGEISAHEIMDKNYDGIITLEECKAIIFYFRFQSDPCESIDKTASGDISVAGAIKLNDFIQPQIATVLRDIPLVSGTIMKTIIPDVLPLDYYPPVLVPENPTTENILNLIHNYLKENHWTDNLKNAAWGYIIWIGIEIILMDVFFVKVHPMGLILINLEVLVLISSWTPLRAAFMAGDYKPYFMALLAPESLQDLGFQALTCFFMLGAFAAEVKTLMDGWALLSLAVSGVSLVYLGLKRVNNEVLNYGDSWMDNADQFLGGMFALATLIIIMDIFFADVDYEQHHSYFGATLLLLAVIYEAVELWSNKYTPHDWSWDTLQDIAYFLLPAVIFFGLMMYLDHNGQKRAERLDEKIRQYEDDCHAAGKDPEVHTNREKFVHYYRSTRSHDTVLRDGRHIFA